MNEGLRHEPMEERRERRSHRDEMSGGLLSFPAVPHLCRRVGIKQKKQEGDRRGAVEEVRGREKGDT